MKGKKQITLPKHFTAAMKKIATTKKAAVDAAIKKDSNKRVKVKK